jgi:hypothetical protein
VASRWRWVEHYGQLYSRETVVTDTALENTTPLTSVEELDSPPTIEELSRLSCGKTPGGDGIPTKVVKAAKESSLLGHLHELLLQCWKEGTLP